MKYKSFFIEIIKTKILYIIWIIILFMFFLYWYFAIDFKALELTFGRWYAIIHIILHYLFVILLVWLILLEIYNIKKNFIKNNKNNKINMFWYLWWVIWIILTWCPACWITLVSFLGISSILSFLPRYWLELKLFSIIALFWTQDIIIWNINWCKILTFNSRIKQKQIILSLILFLLSIILIYIVLIPSKKIILPWDVTLFPTKDYILYTYELDDWCSNSKYFIESYTKTENKTKILWLYIYDINWIKDFKLCKDDLIAWDLTEKDFLELRKKYNEWQIKIINWTNYVVEYFDSKSKNGFIWNYYFLKENKIYKLLVSYLWYDDKYIDYMDNEISKRKVKK